MAEIPSVLQVTQLGPETTPGTGVAATDKMASFGISPKPVPKTNPLNVQGYRFPVGLQVGKEHTEAYLKWWKDTRNDMAINHPASRA